MRELAEALQSARGTADRCWRLTKDIAAEPQPVEARKPLIENTLAGLEGWARLRRVGAEAPN